MASEVNTEVRAAITKGVIAEVACLVVGGVLYFTTANLLWIIGGALAGSAIMLLLMAQAGAFKGRDERR